MKSLAALVMAAMCAAFVVGYSPTTAIDCGGGDDDDDTGDDDTGDDDTGSGPDALKVITFNLRYANRGLRSSPSRATESRRRKCGRGQSATARRFV